MPVEKLLYTRKEAAYALGRSLRRLDYMIANKSIRTQRDGVRVLISVAEVRRVASMNFFASDREGVHAEA